MQFGRRRQAVTAAAPVISAGKCETAVRDSGMAMPGFMTRHHSQLDALS